MAINDQADTPMAFPPESRCLSWVHTLCRAAQNRHILVKVPTPVHITVADDDPTMLLFVQTLLALELPDARIDTFLQPSEALNHVHSISTDLLITDHGMGSMSGTELIRELRKEHHTLPIIMISHNPDVRDEAIAAGANEFLDKKHLTDKLPHLIRSYLALA